LLDLLPKLCGEVLIASAVQQEIDRGRALRVFLSARNFLFILQLRPSFRPFFNPLARRPVSVLAV
jgi:hypothetical protein